MKCKRDLSVLSFLFLIILMTLSRSYDVTSDVMYFERI